MKVLVVDDDRVLADVIAFTLKREGLEAIKAYDGQTALERWRTEEPDIIILDLNLPRLDGYTVCKRIREKANTPIIMLTVRDEEDDIVNGLNLGADDYITKPFSPRQLVARVQAVLRRSQQYPAASILQVGHLSYNANRREVTISDSEPISLTHLEGKLLQYLILNAGRVVTLEDIIDFVWGPIGADRDMLRQLVHRLRSKIEPDPTDPIYIETVPSIGYGLIVDSEAKD
jgi:DNA-binding response OmpR family regulator